MIGGKFAAGGNNIHGHTFFLDSTKAPTVSLPTVPMTLVFNKNKQCQLALAQKIHLSL
jgi:hypothetical protein